MTPGTLLLEKYTAALDRLATVAEPCSPGPRLSGELELQACFYAGEFGLAWRALDGEVVEALHLGDWNREPGPDFVGALLKVDGREVRGDIELDREDLDWERHGHATNPAFDNVVAHVFFKAGKKRHYARTSKNRAVIDVLLRRTMRKPRAAGRPSPTATDPARASALIEAAARFRVEKKRGLWLKAVALHGMPNALLHSLAAGMGYKNNKIPFLLTAQRSGLSRAASSGGEALLFGIAGFLESRSFDGGEPEMRGYTRGLWDDWWRMRGLEGRLSLPPEAWNFSALRPANHPHRRLGALATAARQFRPILAAVESLEPKEFLRVLDALEHPFWTRHASLCGRPLNRPCALVGAQRAADLAANILAPAAGGDQAINILRNLQPGSPIAKTERAAAWLGVPKDTPWLNTALARQGLIQVYEDFHPLPAQEVLDLVI